MNRFWTTILFIVALIVFCSALLLNVESNHSTIVEKMKLLLLQLAVILFAAKLGGEFFSKVLHQPSVLGELISGIAIGPFALGAISLPILGTPLFPLPAGAVEGLAFPISPELYGIATLASVILLFLAGLETDFDQFMRQSLAGTLVGMGGVLGAFTLGNLMTIWFGYADNFMSPIALFMGTISVATSVGITARVLSEQKSLDTPEGSTILAGAVIDDVLGILILAIVVGMVGGKSGHKPSPSTHSGKKIVAQHDSVAHQPKLEETKKADPIDWNKIGLIAYKAFGFWIGATLIGILLAGQIQRFLKFFKNQGTMMALGLGLALLVSGLAEMVGLAAIIGAYAMGLALSKEKIASELEHAFVGVYAVLVPVFFCVMGMLVNVPAMLGEPAILTFSLAYSLVAVISKVIGCSLPTYLVGFNHKGAMRVGIGMLPRGEVALIVAGVGLASGIINMQLFGVAIAMTLITTLLAPPILVKLFDGTPGLKSQESKDTGTETTTESIESPKKQSSYTYTLHNVEESISYSCLKSISTAFQEEGYKVHLRSQEAHIYQATKEGVSVEMREESGMIYFDMPEGQKKEIRTIVDSGLKILKNKTKQLVLKKG